MRPRETKHFRHPELGAITLSCQSLLDPEQSHTLLVYTAAPGTASHEKLQLLAATGSQPAPSKRLG